MERFLLCSDCELGRALWKTSWQLCKMLNQSDPDGPASELLEIKTYIFAKTPTSNHSDIMQKSKNLEIP